MELCLENIRFMIRRYDVLNGNKLCHSLTDDMILGVGFYSYGERRLLLII